jgi:hypothetical protein
MTSHIAKIRALLDQLEAAHPVSQPIPPTVWVHFDANGLVLAAHTDRKMAAVAAEEKVRGSTPLPVRGGRYILGPLE